MGYRCITVNRCGMDAVFPSREQAPYPALFVSSVAAALAPAIHVYVHIQYVTYCTGCIMR